ncbi:hypothetical protein BC833DRAFT_606839 [Globomyces pollinis-pini]|nr:hypothetical protein BC833DRAFT_606839 [Globomyces pollinis-pini]
MILSITAFSISICFLLLSFVLDIRDFKKTTPGTNGSTYCCLLLRIGMFFYSVSTMVYLPDYENYPSFVEQKLGITKPLIVAQLFISFAGIAMFGLFFYYCINFSVILPNANLLIWLKTMNDSNPLAYPIILVLFYMVYLVAFFTPLFMWPEQQLRYFFWRQLMQSIIQLSLAIFLIPVLLNTIVCLFYYMAATRTERTASGVMDNITLAFVRMIVINLILIVYLVWAPAVQLVLDPTLMFQAIPLNHTIYQLPAPKMNWMFGYSGAILSMTSLGKYIKVVSTMELMYRKIRQRHYR